MIVVGFQKVNLQGTIFCLRLSHAIFTAYAARVMKKSYTISTIAIVVGLKHVSKAHDILRVVHDNRKQVVGLAYTKQIVSWTCREHIACDKVVPCKSTSKTCFKSPRHSSCRTRKSSANCMSDLHETLCVLCCVHTWPKHV